MNSSRALRVGWDEDQHWMEDALILNWPKAVSSESSGIPLACCFKIQPAWCSFHCVGRSKVDSSCTWQLWRILTLGLPLCCCSIHPIRWTCWTCLNHLFEKEHHLPSLYFWVQHVSRCYFSGVKKVELLGWHFRLDGFYPEVSNKLGWQGTKTLPHNPLGGRIRCP